MRFTFLLFSVRIKENFLNSASITILKFTIFSQSSAHTDVFFSTTIIISNKN